MLIDLTHTIRSDMPMYPGSPAPILDASHTMTRSGYREASITLVSHTGTHMDAPAHLLQNGATLDVLPVSQFCGRAVVLDVSQGPEIITADFLQAQNGAIRSADFVLFYTGWERKWGTDDYLKDGFPVPDEAAAKYLVSCGLKGVGTDALSIDPLDDGGALAAHHVLLEGSLVIVESLRLRKLVGRRDVIFYALPLLFQDADGAPVRAVAELRDTGRDRL